MHKFDFSPLTGHKYVQYEMNSSYFSRFLGRTNSILFFNLRFECGRLHLQGGDADDAEDLSGAAGTGGGRRRRSEGSH